MMGHRLDAPIRNAAALANVERLKIRQRVCQPDEAFVRHVTRAQRQLFELEQTLCHMHQRLVVYFITERDIQRRNAATTFR